MKFVSKHINFRIVLKPSIPAELLAGRSAVPGLYVLFQDGIANVEDQEVIQMLKKHPSYGDTFVAVTEEEEAALVVKPNSEPEHDVTEIQFGHVGKSQNPKKNIPMTPELKKAVTEMAIEIATKIIQDNAKKDKKLSKNTTETSEVPKTEEPKTDLSPSK